MGRTSEGQCRVYPLEGAAERRVAGEGADRLGEWGEPRRGCAWERGSRQGRRRRGGGGRCGAGRGGRLSPPWRGPAAWEPGRAEPSPRPELSPSQTRRDASGGREAAALPAPPARPSAGRGPAPSHGESRVAAPVSPPPSRRPLRALSPSPVAPACRGLLSAPGTLLPPISPSSP